MALHGMTHGLWQAQEQSPCQMPWAGLLGCGGDPRGVGHSKRSDTEETGTDLEGEIGKPSPYFFLFKIPGNTLRRRQM